MGDKSLKSLRNQGREEEETGRGDQRRSRALGGVASRGCGLAVGLAHPPFLLLPTGWEQWFIQTPWG